MVTTAELARQAGVPLEDLLTLVDLGDLGLMRGAVQLRNGRLVYDLERGLRALERARGLAEQVEAGTLTIAEALNPALK
jgi:hypothetical protein